MNENIVFRSNGIVIRSTGPNTAAVDMVSSCGRTFKNVAQIFEFDGDNPLVQVKQPLGCKGVRRILDTIDKLKNIVVEHQGVTIWNAYADGSPLSYWYSICWEPDALSDASGDEHFDVRDIPTPAEIDRSDDAAVIRYAIEQGWITNEQVSIPCEA